MQKEGAHKAKKEGVGDVAWQHNADLESISEGHARGLLSWEMWLLGVLKGSRLWQYQPDKS